MKLLAGLLFFAVTCLLRAQPQYGLQVIGEFRDHNGVRAYDLNDLAVVTGYTHVGSELRAMTWNQGTVTPLPLAPHGGGGIGEAINDNGRIISSIRNESGQSASGLFRNGQWIDIGYPGSIPQSEAQGINDHDWIIGHGYNPDEILPYVWKNGEMEYLGNVWPTLYHNYPTAINNNGWIIGYAHDREYGRYGGWLWKPESGMQQFALASDVNDHNQILAGDYDSAGVKTATIIDPDGTVRRLGVFDSEFLNNRGEAAGDKYLWGDDREACIYTDGQLYSLNNLLSSRYGMTFEGVKGLNNRGQILTSARPFGEDWTVDVLLTPVPEPGAIVGMALGLALVCLSRRHTDSS